ANLADTSRFCIFQQVYKVALFHTETTKIALRTSGKREATFCFMEIKLAVRTGSQQDNSAANDPGKFAKLSAFSKNFGRSGEREKLKPPHFIDRRRRKVRCGNRSRRLLERV
ncbi:MAG TPA: hypothetical protein VK632_00970, partial [Verrucomicrobiae bacterium]|nr:hypothetical protein [Verrucomicrobiae bacterium]